MKKTRAADSTDRKLPRDQRMRLTLEQPTAGVDFGLQKGRGGSFEIIQKQRSDGKDVTFEFSVTVKAGKDGLPDFSGPLVQGGPGERFFYVNIGTYAGQENTSWSRRLKVPLSGISWDLIDAQGVLIATIPGKAKDGGPSCAYEWRKRVASSWQWQLERLAART